VIELTLLLLPFLLLSTPLPTQSESSEGKRSPKRNSTIEKERGWTYLGRNKSHSKKITGLEFTQREDWHDVLVSVGEDRRLVEYDLTTSSVERGLW